MVACRHQAPNRASIGEIVPFTTAKQKGLGVPHFAASKPAERSHNDERVRAIIDGNDSHPKHNFVLAGKFPDVTHDRSSILRFTDLREGLSKKNEQIVPHRMRHFPSCVDFSSPPHTEHLYNGLNSLGSHFGIQNITRSALSSSMRRPVGVKAHFDFPLSIVLPAWLLIESVRFMG
jgi:hypothetical protein